MNTYDGGINPNFRAFPKIPRLSREIVITEKIDGTNALVWVNDQGDDFLVGSRKRFITPHEDNFGFAGWCKKNKEELLKLGPGMHHGEWWGRGIQRGYGLEEKRFSLFNVGVWNEDNCPKCCDTVPVLYRGIFDTRAIEVEIQALEARGSIAAPGYMNPEGIIIFHIAANLYFKKTIVKDEEPKGRSSRGMS